MVKVMRIVMAAALLFSLPNLMAEEAVRADQVERSVEVIQTEVPEAVTVADATAPKVQEEDAVKVAELDEDVTAAAKKVLEEEAATQVASLEDADFEFDLNFDEEEDVI